ELLLTDDHVADRKARKREVRLGSTVAGRARHAVTDRVGTDDEVPVRIKRATGADQEIQPVMDGADCRQRKDGVVACGGEPPVSDIADLEIANDFAALQLEVAELDFPVRTVDPAGLQLRMLPSRLTGSHSQSPGGNRFEPPSRYAQSAGR